MKAIIRISALAIVALLFTSNTRTDIRSSMVRFDQAFLPALEYTLRGDIQQAKRAVFYLEFQWRKLRSRLDNRYPGEGRHLSRIDDWLGDAYYAIDANCPVTAANQLEHVKYELMVLRDRHDIDYYLDGLFDFQGGLETVAEAAGDEMLCLMEWAEFVALTEALEREWLGIRHRPFDAALYEFDAAKLRRLRYEQQRMADALENFAKAVEKADRRKVEEASKALEPAFDEVLRLFGNYEGPQTHFAQQ